MALTPEDYELFKNGAVALDRDGDPVVFTGIQGSGQFSWIAYDYIGPEYFFSDRCPEFYALKNFTLQAKSTESSIFDNIRSWADERNLLDPSRVDKQMLKLGEEFGELAGALAKGNEVEAFDAIGDMVVVLTILAMQKGWRIEAAIEAAYDVIKNRTGQTINGIFIKDGK